MLCEHLEGWDREGEREAQAGGDMGMYVYKADSLCCAAGTSTAL